MALGRLVKSEICTGGVGAQSAPGRTDYWSFLEPFAGLPTGPRYQAADLHRRPATIACRGTSLAFLYHWVIQKLRDGLYLTYDDATIDRMVRERLLIEVMQ
jgi:hypothetical protein